MSGELVGLVITHGPRDPGEWAVAIVVAEDMHHAADTAVLSLDELARRARLGRSTTARVVKQLRAAGWLTYAPGGGRGVANRYALVMARFSTGTETVPERDGMTPEKQSRSGTVSAVNSPADDVNSPAAGLSTVPVGSPSTEVVGKQSRHDTVLPGVLAGVRTGPDDAQIQRALETFALAPSKTLRTELGRAFDRGQTPQAVNAHLRANVDVRNCRDVVAVLVRLVRELPAVVATIDRTDEATCDVCALSESDCRRRRHSGHQFTHDPAGLSAVMNAVLDDVERSNDLTARMARATSRYEPLRRRGGRAG